jgi:hypothetical protein
LFFLNQNPDLENVSFKRLHPGVKLGSDLYPRKILSMMEEDGGGGAGTNLGV